VDHLLLSNLNPSDYTTTITTTITTSSTTMDSATLKQTQAPIKQKYKDDPSSALVTLSSTGQLSSTSVACKLSNSKAIKDAHDKVTPAHLNPNDPRPRPPAPR